MNLNKLLFIFIGPIAASGSAPLLQAIAAYKAMNLTIPASLQIKALQEQLKEAQVKTGLSTETTAEENGPKNEAIVPSSESHESAETKDQEPDKQADTPNGAAEVTKKIMELGANAAKYYPQSAPQFQKLQQLNFVQQKLLKEMLLNAAVAAKPEKVTEHEDKEQTSVEDILNLGHEKDNTVKQTQLLQILQNMQKKGAQEASFQGLANAAQLTSNFIKEPTSADTVTPDSKSTAGSQSQSIDRIIAELVAGNKEEKDNSALKEAKTTNAITPDNVSSLDVPDNEQDTINPKSDKESNNLVNLLSIAGLIKHKRKHHKRKHEPENPYAKIGYEAVDGVKKNIKSAQTASRTTTKIGTEDANSAQMTTGIENASDSRETNSPVETLTYEDQEETSKKNTIKEEKKDKETKL